MLGFALHDLAFSIRNGRPMLSGTPPPSTEMLYPTRFAALEERLAAHKARAEDSETPTARLRAGWHDARAGAQGPRPDHRDVKREYPHFVECLGHPTLGMYLLDFNMRDPRAFVQLAKGVQGLEDALHAEVPKDRARRHRRLVMYDGRQPADCTPHFGESHCGDDDAEKWRFIEAEIEMAEVTSTTAKKTVDVGSSSPVPPPPMSVAQMFAAMRPNETRKLPSFLTDPPLTDEAAEPAGEVPEPSPMCVPEIPAQPAAGIDEEQEEVPLNPKHAQRCKIHSPIPGVPDAAQKHLCVGLELFIESILPFLEALPTSCAPLLPGPLQFCMRLEKITLKEGETLPSTEWRPVHGRVAAVVHHVITRSFPMAGGDIDLAGGAVPLETTSDESQDSADKPAKGAFPSPAVRAMYSGCDGVRFVPGSRVSNRFQGEYTVVCAGGPNGAAMRNRKMWVKPGLEQGDAMMTVLTLYVIDQRAPLSHSAPSKPNTSETFDAMDEDVSDREEVPVEDERVGETLLLTKPESFDGDTGMWFAPLRAHGVDAAVLASWLNKCPSMLRVKAWRLATLGIGPVFFEPGSDLELHVIKHGGSHTFVVVRKPDTAMPLHGGRAMELVKSHGVSNWLEFKNEELWASSTGLTYPTSIL